MIVETWKPIPGYEGRYEVSDLGRVRRLARTLARRIGKGDRPNDQRPCNLLSGILRPAIASHGYLTVSLTDDSGRKRTWCLHTLVLTAFQGPRPKGLVARHLDGDKLYNALSNLAWGTYRENAADMDRHGRRRRGQSYASAKITDETAAEIRSLKGFLSQSVTAVIYGISPSAVQAVHDGRTWKHIPSLSFDDALLLRSQIFDAKAAIKAEMARRA